MRFVRIWGVRIRAIRIPGTGPTDLINVFAKEYQNLSMGYSNRSSQFTMGHL